MWCSEELQILLQAQHQLMLMRSFSTLNEIEIQVVKVASESPWHRWQVGTLTLIMLAWYEEPVVVVWEFWKMTRPQQEALRSEGINRHEWERKRHSALFMRRGPEIGRLSACVQKSHDYDDQILFNNKFQRMLVLVGCVIFLLSINFKMKIFRNCREARLRRWVSEGQEWAEDVWTFRSRNRTSLHQSAGAKHQEDTSFAGCVCNEMMITRSWRCILTPHCHPQDIQQRIAHILIDIFSNITFSPKMRRWAFSRKNLKRLRRALVQDHLLSFVILN